ncbi:NFAT activation molecule 1 [Pagrus major]|uniref:NFAT activation molecule 1 n=1 Tax=Pagrus major TaxID=143350 RepID=UPI003CC83C6A
MAARALWHLSFISTWIFVFFFSSVCSGITEPKLNLESRVFVAFTGEDLNIKSSLQVPANQTNDILTCSDPFHTQIYECAIPLTTNKPTTFDQTLELKNLNISGEYSCRYKNAKVFWFLRVRNDGYKEPTKDYTEFIIVAVLTAVLLVFSVVGSVYVFRGHWEERGTDSGNAGRKQKQNREDSKEKEMEKDNVDAITATSTSFYASLEARPRSIYDVLDHSAANREPEQSKAKPKKKEPKKKEPKKREPKKKEPKKPMVQTTQPQNEDVFESVYENF